MTALTVSSSETSTNTGTTPLKSGCAVFCMGSEAISEIIMVTTSSLGCMSLIWRFPIRRMARMTKTYKMTVRITAINIASPLLPFPFAFGICIF